MGLGQETQIRGQFNDKNNNLKREHPITATKVAIKSNFGNSAVGFIYEVIDEDGGPSQEDRNNILVNISYKFEKWLTAVQGGILGDSSIQNAKDGGSFLSLMAKHQISKMFSYYLATTTITNNTNGTSLTVYNSPIDAVAGDSQTGIGFGMFLSF